MFDSASKTLRYLILHMRTQRFRKVQQLVKGDTIRKWHGHRLEVLFRSSDRVTPFFFYTFMYGLCNTYAVLITWSLPFLSYSFCKHIFPSNISQARLWAQLLYLSIFLLLFWFSSCSFTNNYNLMNISSQQRGVLGPPGQSCVVVCKNTSCPSSLTFPASAHRQPTWRQLLKRAK